MNRVTEPPQYSYAESRYLLTCARASLVMLMVKSGQLNTTKYREYRKNLFHKCMNKRTHWTQSIVHWNFCQQNFRCNSCKNAAASFVCGLVTVFICSRPSAFSYFGHFVLENKETSKLDVQENSLKYFKILVSQQFYCTCQ